MRDAIGELPNDFHFLGLEKFLLELAPRGDVAKQHEQALPPVEFDAGAADMHGHARSILPEDMDLAFLRRLPGSTSSERDSEGG